MKKIFILATLILVALTGCKNQPAEEIQDVQIANPASQHCEEKGGKIKLRDQTGWCIFPDNSECEEWAFFRGECLPQTVHKLEEGQLQKCITGYDHFGKSQFKLIPAGEACPQITTQKELNNLCGKDTNQVIKCDNLIKLISTNPQAGNMFFQGNKILSCPNTNTENTSQDCQNALSASCDMTVNCD